MKKRGGRGKLTVTVKLEYAGNAKVWIIQTSHLTAVVSKAAEDTMDKIEEAILDFTAIVDQDPVDK